VHSARVAGVVGDGVVAGAAVVPHHQRIGLPADAAGEFGALDVGHQEIEYGLAFIRGEAVEALDLIADEQAFASRFRMRADERVDGDYRFRVAAAATACVALGPTPWAPAGCFSIPSISSNDWPP